LGIRYSIQLLGRRVNAVVLPGCDEIRLPAGRHELDADIEVESITPIASVDLLHDNRVVAQEKPAGRPLKVRFRKTVTADHSGWFAVRVMAEPARHPLRRAYPFAATMPVWLIVDGRPPRSREDARYFIRWMDATLEKALALRAWNNESEREQTRKLYAEARARMEAHEE